MPNIRRAASAPCNWATCLNTRPPAQIIESWSSYFFKNSGAHRTCMKAKNAACLPSASTSLTSCDTRVSPAPFLSSACGSASCASGSSSDTCQLSSPPSGLVELLPGSAMSESPSAGFLPNGVRFSDYGQIMVNSKARTTHQVTGSQATELLSRRRARQGRAPQSSTQSGKSDAGCHTSCAHTGLRASSDPLHHLHAPCCACVSVLLVA